MSKMGERTRRGQKRRSSKQRENNRGIRGGLFSVGEHAFMRSCVGEDPGEPTLAALTLGDSYPRVDFGRSR
jgi:hypothetical protein